MCRDARSTVEVGKGCERLEDVRKGYSYEYASLWKIEVLSGYL